MIYLASPYSHIEETDANVFPEVTREQRYLHTKLAMSILLKRGDFVYSPIVHCHELAKTFKMPTDAEFWKEYNQDFIKSSKAVWVLTLGGWRFSKGVNSEINYAIEIGKPLRFLDFDIGFGDLIDKTDYIIDVFFGKTKQS